MREGATRTEADVLLFFDADLVGLTPRHVQDLLAPVCSGEATMAMGIFQGRAALDRHGAVLRPGHHRPARHPARVFLQIPDLESVGYGIELAINDYVHSQGLVRRDVTLRGVTHPMKEEKLGWARGAASRSRMYCQMLKFRLSLRGHRKSNEAQKEAGRE